MVKIDVHYDQEKNNYTPQEYSRLNTVSSLGTEMGWIIPETLSTLVESLRQVEKTFQLNTGLKGICNTVKLIKGLELASLGYEFVYAVTTSLPKELGYKGVEILDCHTSRIDRIDAVASFLGEISAVCGCIKFFHRIEAVNISHLISGVETTKYSAGLASCALNIYSAKKWINTQKPKNFSDSAKEAHQARLLAKKYSYYSNASLSALYGALLVNKRMKKVNNYVFLVAGLATSISLIALHFKTAKADHAEAKFAFKSIAPAA